MQHTATHSNSLQPTATHRNPLQHTTTLCNTLQCWHTCNAKLGHSRASCHYAAHFFFGRSLHHAIRGINRQLHTQEQGGNYTRKQTTHVRSSRQLHTYLVFGRSVHPSIKGKIDNYIHINKYRVVETHRMPYGLFPQASH